MLRKTVLLVAVAAALIQWGPAYGFNPNTDPSLTGWWRLDDGAGDTAADSSSGGHNGTLVNGPAWTAGHYGGGLQLDGTDDYVDTGLTTNLATWTIAIWVTSPAAPNGTGSPSGPLHRENNYQFNWSHSNGGQWPGSVASNVGGTWTPASLGPLQGDTWYFLAGTFDGTSLKAYKDGVLITTVAIAGTPSSDTNTMKLGRHAANAQYFGGTVDDARVYDRALTEQEIQEVMKGGVNPGLASTPTPKEDATDVPRDVVLGWITGTYPGTHDVYFGTAFDDVNNASRTSPAGLLVSQGQTAATYDPAGLLPFGQTYYWRVDEVNASADATLYKGSPWRFTTEPYGYAVTPIKATASSSLSSAMGPEKTIDGSGLDSQDQHSTSASHMWLSKKNVTPIWIQYELDKVYKLYQMWVWNSNQSVELDIGFGAHEVSIQTSVDGSTWTTLAGVTEFNQATGEPNYVANTIVDFAGAQAKFVKITISANWADSTKQAGLAEVRFFYVPVKAFGPTPGNGATGVAMDSVLNWRPGREAVKHEVYLSADADAVAKGSAPVKTVSAHSLGLSTLGLEYGKTYTWKVNEVNDAATPSSWEGDLWTFTTPDSGVVDDFESYNDTCNRVFFAWVDGFGHNGSTDCSVAPSAGNGSGSTVGNTNPPFAEKTIIHGGKQSMPLAYDNTAGKSFSEATRTFEPSQDWTLGGAKTLVLFVRGASDNGAGQFYVKINGTRVDYTGTSSLVTAAMWKQWNIDLASVGTNLKSIKTLAIGVSGSGKGSLYIDDVLLYRAAPAVVQPTDPGANGLAALYRMEGDTKDSSGKGNNGTAMGTPAYGDSLAGFGKALQFEGIDDYVDLPIGSLMSTLNSATFSMWLNWPAEGGTWQRVFDFGSSTTNYMFLTPSAGGNLTSPLRFAIRMTTSSAESIISAPAVMPTGWHHVAVAIDGTAKTMQLWLDGSIVASGATLVIPKDLGNTNQNWLGRSQFTADAYYQGAIDEFRIYSRLLSAGEIRFLTGDR